MVDIKIVRELRTKEEVINYFKQQGINVTEEEIYALKQSYSKMQESNGALTQQQLDDVAGGVVFYKRLNSFKIFNEKVLEPYTTCSPKVVGTEELKKIQANFDKKDKILILEGGLGTLTISYEIDLKEPSNTTDEQAINCFLHCVDFDSSHSYLDFDLVKTFIKANSTVQERYKQMYEQFKKDHKGKATSFGNHLFCSKFTEELGIVEKYNPQTNEQPQQSSILDSSGEISTRDALIYAGLSVGVLIVFAAAATGIVLTANNNKNK